MPKKEKPKLKPARTVKKLAARREDKKNKQKAKSKRRQDVAAAVAAKELGISQAHAATRKVPKPQGLQIYWQLASLKKDEREAAAFSLVEELRRAQARYEGKDGHGGDGLKQASTVASRKTTEAAGHRVEDEESEENGLVDGEGDDATMGNDHVDVGSDSLAAPSGDRATEVQLNGCCTEVCYAVQRLVRGMSSSRGVSGKVMQLPYGRLTDGKRIGEWRNKGPRDLDLDQLSGGKAMASVSEVISPRGNMVTNIASAVGRGGWLDSQEREQTRPAPMSMPCPAVVVTSQAATCFLWCDAAAAALRRLETQAV